MVIFALPKRVENCQLQRDLPGIEASEQGRYGRNVEERQRFQNRPALLGRLIDSVPKGLAQATKRTEVPGLFFLVQKFSSKDSRRGLAAAAEILETFGRSLGSDLPKGKEG